MSRILLAIDPGSFKCGIAVFKDRQLYHLETIKSSSLTPIGRRIGIALSLHEWIKAADYVICEEPFLQGQNNNGMQRLLGMIEYITGISINFIHPMSLKKLVCPGKKEKIDVALAAGELLKTDEEKELLAQSIAREAFDETDAAAIGLSFYLNRKEI